MTDIKGGRHWLVGPDVHLRHGSMLTGTIVVSTPDGLRGAQIVDGDTLLACGITELPDKENGEWGTNLRIALGKSQVPIHHCDHEAFVTENRERERIHYYLTDALDDSEPIEITNGIEDLEQRFTYHPPKDGDTREIYGALRRKAGELAYMIFANSTNTVEATTALQKVEEAIMWANAGIARHGRSPYRTIKQFRGGPDGNHLAYADTRTPHDPTDR